MAADGDARVDAASGLPVTPPGKPVTFTFDGRNVPGFSTDSVASALHADGDRALMRSIKYHRPRGYFCGVGKCAGCLVRVDGVPNVRACTLTARPGLRVESQNAWPSARFDVLGVIDQVFRKRFDHHARFIRPRFMKPVFDAVIRRMAGFGDAPDQRPLPPRRPAIARATPAVAVVGAGAAGLAAATAAADAGARVMLVEERPRLGGTLRYETGPVEASPHGAARAEAFSVAVEMAGVDVQPNATAFGWYRDGVTTEPHGQAPLPHDEAMSAGTLAVLTDKGVIEVRPHAVVVATGAHDVPPLFAGNDMPGVMGARAAQRLLFDHGVKPGRRAVIVGGDALAATLAEQLAAAGVAVEATVAENGVARAHGARRVKAVTLDDGRRIACDVVVSAVARAPRLELLQQADVEVTFDGATPVPVVGADGATGLPGVFAAGSCAGSPTASASVDAGRAAGRAAAAFAARHRRPKTKVVA